MVACPAYALKAAGDAGRGFDLNYQIDCAHIDSKFERRCRHQRRQPSRLQIVLDLKTLLACNGSMVRSDDIFASQFIERRCEPFGQSAAIDENQRGSVLADLVEQHWMDGGPDAGPHLALCGRTAGNILDFAQSGHILNRNGDANIQFLAAAGIDKPHGARTNGLIAGYILEPA